MPECHDDSSVEECSFYKYFALELEVPSRSEVVILLVCKRSLEKVRILKVFRRRAYCCYKCFKFVACNKLNAGKIDIPCENNKFIDINRVAR